jgi:hypothetical protein
MSEVLTAAIRAGMQQELLKVFLFLCSHKRPGLAERQASLLASQSRPLIHPSTSDGDWRPRTLLDPTE